MLSRMSLRLHHRALTKTYKASEVLISNRSLHLSRKYRQTGLKSSDLFALSKHKHLLGAAYIRHASTESGKEILTEDVLPSIPEPPVPAPEIIDIVQAGGEPALSTLGLAGWTPPGMVQSALEWLHIGCGLPWWGTIVIGTICVRILIIPLVLKAQRNSAQMANHMPQIQRLQVKMTEARQTGNNYEATKYGQELMLYMKEKGVSPFKSMVVPLAQAPLFISFFMGLRGMANAPVESMRDGGLWWFMDLTVPDPYYLLPIITSATMFLTIKIGVDGIKMSTMGTGMAKYFVQAIPFVMFPFIVHFPGAILCYWTSTNFISLLQTGILKIPSVRTSLGIPETIKHADDDLVVKDKGFVKGFKESLSNMKVAREMSDRGYVDHLEFERAGKGPIPKTFKYDPTRQAQSSSAILTKKRD